MKSPLVEALKQAGSDDAAPEEVEHQALEQDASNAPGVDEPALDTDALTLMDSMVILPIDGTSSPASNEPAPPDDTLGDPPPEPEPSAPTSDKPELMDLDMGEAANRAPTVAAGFVAGSSTRAVGVSRLGRYTPIIAIALLASAAVAQVVYQRVGSGPGGNAFAPATALSSTSPNIDGLSPTDAAPNPFPLNTQSPPPRPRTAPAPRQFVAAPNVETRTPVLTIASTDQDDKAFGLLNRAFAAFESGDLGGAEAAYREALQVAPQHPNALQGLAAILNRTGRNEESLQLYESLLSVDPDNTDAVIALLNGRDNAPNASESDIKHLIQRHPASAHLRFALGASMAREERWPEARHAFEQALQLDGSNADYFFNLAVSLEHLGRVNAARQNYLQALAVMTPTSSLDRDVVNASVDRLGGREREGGLQ